MERPRLLHALRSRAGSARSDHLRVAVVAESFSPAVNGVTNSVLRLTEHLTRRGHEALVIAPGPGPSQVEGVPVIRMRAFDMPRYADLRVGIPSRRLVAALRDFDPHVVHLAAPAFLGAMGALAARRMSIPSVAVYQTDLAGFARRHGAAGADRAIWAWIRWVHRHADRTLAPSTASIWALRHHGVRNVHHWGRGVDLIRFDPSHRCGEIRRRLAPADRPIVGFVGRLAKEKQVHRLAGLSADPGLSVVIVGDGPERRHLEQRMPGATFLGLRTGAELGRLYASFDVFVHPGLDETFCQAVQEALASGVPVVAPSVGGPLDLVSHGVNGYLWSPDSPWTLDAAARQLAHDPITRARMGTAARASVSGRPWSVILDELIGHYRAVMNRRSPAPRALRPLAALRLEPRSEMSSENRVGSEPAA